MTAKFPEIEVQGNTETFQCSVTREDWDKLKVQFTESEKRHLETEESLKTMAGKIDELTRICVFLETSLRNKECENNNLLNLNAKYLQEIESLKESSKWSNLLPSKTSVLKIIGAIGALGAGGVVMTSAYNWKNLSTMLMKS